MDEANRALLDRDLAVAEMRSLSSAIDLLDELVDYGTNLVPRCLATGERTLADRVILGVVAKQAVELFDSVAVLLRAGAVLPAGVLARAILEAQIYLAFLLVQDTEFRAAHYYAWYLRQMIRALEPFVDGTAANEEMREATKNVPFDWSYTGRPQGEEVRREQSELRARLSRPDLANANQRLHRCKSWFQPFGPNSIRDLARHCGMSVEYDVFYRHYSSITHSQSVHSHVAVADYAISLEQMRSPRHATSVLLQMHTMGFTLLQMLVDHYRPGEAARFRQIFLEKWRPRSQALRNTCS